jgi:hypothetical protein
MKYFPRRTLLLAALAATVLIFKWLVPPWLGWLGMEDAIDVVHQSSVTRFQEKLQRKQAALDAKRTKAVGTLREKTLEELLAQLAPTAQELPYKLAADELRRRGAAAVPELLRLMELDRQESTLAAVRTRLAAGKPPRAWDFSSIVAALRELGPMARPAIPLLEKWCEDADDTSSLHPGLAGLVALAEPEPILKLVAGRKRFFLGLGMEALSQMPDSVLEKVPAARREEVVPTLVSLVSPQGQPNGDSRHQAAAQAAHILGVWRVADDATVDALLGGTKALGEEAEAIRALARLPLPAKRIIPALLPALTKAGAPHAADALRRMAEDGRLAASGRAAEYAAQLEAVWRGPPLLRQGESWGWPADLALGLLRQAVAKDAANQGNQTLASDTATLVDANLLRRLRVHLRYEQIYQQLYRELGGLYDYRELHYIPSFGDVSNGFGFSTSGRSNGVGRKAGKDWDHTSLSIWAEIGLNGPPEWVNHRATFPKSTVPQAEEVWIEKLPSTTALLRVKAASVAGGFAWRVRESLARLPPPDF